MSDQQEDLKLIMAYSIQHDESFKTFSQLKFKNTVYNVNDDIMLIQKLDQEKSQPMYGKIITFATIKKIEFPVLLVSWYYSNKDEIASEIALGNQELVMSDYVDWQYVETVMGKIKLVSEQEFADLDNFEKENGQIFYRKNCIWQGQPSLSSEQQIICPCSQPSNPEKTLFVCGNCEILHHHHCSGSDKICLICNN